MISLCVLWKIPLDELQRVLGDSAVVLNPRRERNTFTMVDIEVKEPWAYKRLLWHIVGHNLRYGNAYPSILHPSGLVRYDLKTPGVSIWPCRGVMHTIGRASCVGLGCAYAAELLLRGIAAEPVIKEGPDPWNPNDGKMNHVLVKVYDPSTGGYRHFDPSLALGMGSSDLLTVPR